MEDRIVAPPYTAAPLRLLPFHGLSIVGSRVGEPALARAFARPYRKVPERLAEWRQHGALWRDPEAALYLHEYTAGQVTVRGLVGALDLTRRTDDPGSAAVFPHEGIHLAQADHLTRRLEQMQLNPAPILLAHRGSGALRRLLDDLQAGPPVLDLSDRADQRHRVWALRGPEAVELVAGELRASHALIADGHHRYGAYLRLQAAAPGTPADRGLAMLIDQDDTPLHLGAVHRVLAGVEIADVVHAATAAGSVGWRPGDQETALAALEPGTMVLTDGSTWGALHTAGDREQTMVEHLHDKVLPVLRPGPARLDYHHSVEETLSALSGGDVAVLLPAPELALVLRAVEAGRLLPEKATSFQPKPSVGVLMRSLLDG